MKINSRLIMFNIIIFIFVINISNVVSKANNIYDLQDINKEVIKPISDFMIEYFDENGECKTVCANSKFYDSNKYIFDQEANHITLKEGTKIRIKDLSAPGSGDKICKWDLQIYTPNDEYLYLETKKENVEKELILEEGEYQIYLSVMDDYENVKGYDNWSVNGNHRWLTESKIDKGDYYYWYFSQLNITVLDKDLEEKEEIPKEENNDENNDEENEEKNYNPETWIIKDDILYPKEITDKKIKTNIISWNYYDNEGDEFFKSGYKLYKTYDVKRGKIKELISQKDDIFRLKECEIKLDGFQNEEFYLEVYVIDEFGNIGNANETLKINSFMPDLKIENYDRVYLNEILEIDLVLKDDVINRNLELNYESYKVLDEKNNIIVSGTGKICENFLVNEMIFEQEKTYEILQTISNSVGKIKEVRSRFFVVPILKPEIILKNMSGYYGTKIETQINIVQNQSPLKGKLKDYIYEFKNEDGYFEIYKDGQIIFSQIGILKELVLDERMNIERSLENQIFKIKQYVKNSKGKTGEKEVNLLVKVIPDDGINLEICERDEDITTIKNEIYKNESLLFKTDYFVDGKIKEVKSNVLDSSGNVVYESNDLLNGLIKFDLPEDEYKASVEVKYINKKGEEKILHDEEHFKVKKIEKPIINIKGGKQEYTKLEKLLLDIEVIDINKSEEHPRGFDYNLYYEIGKQIKKDDKMQTLMSKDELFKEMFLENFESNSYYLLKQKATNKEYNEISSEEEIKFYVKNMLPVITISKEEKYFVGENILVSIEAEDIDGYISELKLTNAGELEDNENLKNLEIVTEKTELKKSKMHISFKANKTTTLFCRVSATDDNCENASHDFEINILNSDFYSNIELLTKEKERQKENRYLRIKYGNSKAENDCLKIFVEEKINEKERKNIYEKTINLNKCNEFYEDEKIKILVEEVVDNNQKIAGLYFKQAGNYQIESFSEIGDVRSQSRKIYIPIKFDELPNAALEINFSKYRNKETSKANATLDIKIVTDDQIGKIEFFVDEEIRNIDKIEKVNEFVYEKGEKEIELMGEFEFFENELGKKKVKIKINEEHNFLPPKEHIFFEELIAKFKSNFSNEYFLEIENIEPSLNYLLDKQKIKIRVIG